MHDPSGEQAHHHCGAQQRRAPVAPCIAQRAGGAVAMRNLMNPLTHRGRMRGSSLLEIVVAIAILMLIIGSVLELINTAQFRHTSEQDFLPALQMARSGLDQIIRDVHRAGYPSPFLYTAT